MEAVTRTLGFAGHKLAYRVSGRGPALVVLSQYWQPGDEVRDRLLGDRWELFHITPVGYGKSDRVPGYAGEALTDQVLTVLDHHKVHRFAVWGYSAGGAMAACVARATSRTAGLICGGFALFDQFTPGTMRQLDRRLDPEHASRSLWSWVGSIDWTAEIPALLPCLMYWGSQDRQMATKLRDAERQLLVQGVDFVEFSGLDHPACNHRNALQATVIPTVAEWLSLNCEA